MDIDPLRSGGKAGSLLVPLPAQLMLGALGGHGIRLRKRLRAILTGLTWPVRAAFWFVPLPQLSYVAGAGYGLDRHHRLLFRGLMLIVGGHVRYAQHVLNQRLKGLSTIQRRDAAQHVWTSRAALGWGERAFADPKTRCAEYAYGATRSLYRSIGRSLSILELGAMNGASLFCLQFQGVDIARFVGVDISAAAVHQASQHWPDESRFVFHCGDFLDYCRSTDSQFDALLVKQTFLFLDQDYLEQLIGVISDRGIATRIVIQERQRAPHLGPHSAYGNWGNTPVDYSHDYSALFGRAGWTIESGGLRPHPTVADTLLLEAVFVRA